MTWTQVLQEIRRMRFETPFPRWKPGEAKARFSEVGRLAAAGRPQRVMVHGRDRR